MNDRPKRDNAEEMDEAEMVDYAVETSPPSNLSDFATKIMGGFAVKNAKFIETNSPELCFLLADISDEILQDNILDSGDTLCSMLLEIVHPQFISLVYDLLFGNLLGCYVSMRIMLEAVVDSVVASTRFSDYPFPDDLEMLRQLERKLNINFPKKCVLLLPKETNTQIRGKICELYDYLSRFWVHPKGVAKALKERKGSPEGWMMFLPCYYIEDDIVELREFVQKLREFGEYIHELLQPAIKYFKTQAPNPP